jgi:hypothetical protein
VCHPNGRTEVDTMLKKKVLIRILELLRMGRDNRMTYARHKRFRISEIATGHATRCDRVTGKLRHVVSWPCVSMLEPLFCLSWLAIGSHCNPSLAEFLPSTPTRQPRITSRGFESLWAWEPPFQCSVSAEQGAPHTDRLLLMIRYFLLNCIMSSCTFFSVQGHFSVCCS